MADIRPEGPELNEEHRDMVSIGQVTVEDVEEPGWEVDGPDGAVIYLGRDLTLADELYNCLPPGSRLHPAAAPAR
jgi:hypothetical protein